MQAFTTPTRSAPPARLPVTLIPRDYLDESKVSTGASAMVLPAPVETTGPETDRKVARLQVRLRRARQDTILGLLGALEARDEYTHRHSINVSIYAARITGYFPIPPRERLTIQTAALLHDIGKVGIPDAILLKPGVLTKAEMIAMREHAAIGAAMLKSITLLQAERTLVLHHHEWYDGRGYPHGLAGEDIPFGARVIHMADSIDAMVSPRVYKAGFDLPQTLKELIHGRGRQFDPRVADAAIRWLSESPEEIIRPVSVSHPCGA